MEHLYLALVVSVGAMGPRPHGARDCGRGVEQLYVVPGLTEVLA